jgi:hypothetical protein
MKRLRPQRLTRELIWVLAVKLALIVTIKLVFFSDAVKPSSDAVARALLSTQPSAQRNSVQ